MVIRIIRACDRVMITRVPRDTATLKLLGLLGLLRLLGLLGLLRLLGLSRSGYYGLLRLFGL